MKVKIKLYLYLAVIGSLTILLKNINVEYFTLCGRCYLISRVYLILLFSKILSWIAQETTKYVTGDVKAE